MIRITRSELYANLEMHLDQVGRDRAELVVTSQNRPELVILPLSELESSRETMHLLSTKANARRLLDSIAELDAGAI